MRVPAKQSGSGTQLTLVLSTENNAEPRDTNSPSPERAESSTILTDGYSLRKGLAMLHDDSICSCEWGLTQCSCTCDQCCKYNFKFVVANDIAKTEQLLLDIGISPSDLADLVWTKWEQRLKDLFATIARNELRAALTDVKFYGTVDRNSIKWRGSA